MDTDKTPPESRFQAVVDTHICGACQAKFNDVKLFLQHKEQGCPPQVSLAVEGQPQESQQGKSPSSQGSNHLEPQRIHADQQRGQNLSTVCGQAQGDERESHKIRTAPCLQSHSSKQYQHKQQQHVLLQSLLNAPNESSTYPTLNANEGLVQGVPSQLVGDSNGDQILGPVLTHVTETGPQDGSASTEIPPPKTDFAISTPNQSSVAVVMEVPMEQAASQGSSQFFHLQPRIVEGSIRGALCPTANHTEAGNVVTQPPIMSHSQSGLGQTSELTNATPSLIQSPQHRLPPLDHAALPVNVQHSIVQTDGSGQSLNPTEIQSPAVSRSSLPLTSELNPPGVPVTTSEFVNPMPLQLVVSPQRSVTGGNIIQAVIESSPPFTASPQPVRVQYTPTKKSRNTPNKRFKCSYEGCSFFTAYWKDLKRHTRTHTGERPFTCEFCSKSFNRSDKLKIHLRGHTGDKPYACQFCNYASADSSSLKKHLRIHTDERPFKCQICPYASRNSSQLIVHLRTHTGDSPFQCQFCDAKFKINTDLKRHMRIHTGEKPYQCDKCDYKCSIKGNLKSHIRINHSMEPLMRCEQCDFSSSSKKGYREHLKTHNPDSPARCSTCDYLCSGKTALKNHMRVHSDDRPFHCEFCNYTSKQKGNVKTHTRKRHPQRLRTKKLQQGQVKRASETSQTDSRQGEETNMVRYKRKTLCRQGYQCSQCNASFVREDSLRSHVRQHKEIATLESTALAVLDLQHPVIANPSSVAPTSLPTTEGQVVHVVSPAQSNQEGGHTQSALPSSAVYRVSSQISAPHSTVLVPPPVSDSQNVQPATSYIYTVPQGNVGLVSSSSTPVSHTSQQQLISAPLQVASSHIEPSSGQAVSTPLHQTSLPAGRLVQTTHGLQVVPSIQYPVIRLPSGQLFSDSQMIGTQFVTGQRADNIVAVLGAPMASFIGQFQPESVPQIAIATTVASQTSAQLHHPQQQQQQHFEHQQVSVQQQQQQLQEHLQIQQEKQFHQHQQIQQHVQEQQQEQHILTSQEAVITGDGATTGLPVSIQLVQQRLPPVQTTEMTNGVAVPRLNLETLAQVIEHPLAATPGAVQVVFPSGTQAVLPAQTEGSPGVTAQPNLLVHVPGIGPGGEASLASLPPTIMPIQFIQSTGHLGVQSVHVEQEGGKGTSPPQPAAHVPPPQGTNPAHHTDTGSEELHQEAE